MSTHSAPAPTSRAHVHIDPVHYVPVRSLMIGGLIGAKVPALCGEFITAAIGDTGEPIPDTATGLARGEVCPTCELLARAMPNGGQR